MSWTQTLFELIDMRSFSNLWYWIVLAVVWSTASHWVLGVPYDMVLRAKRQGGQAEADLEDIVRINVNRLLYIGQVSGLWLAGFACFFLTMLVLLGFVYGVEFAQAVLLLAAHYYENRSDSGAGWMPYGVTSLLRRYKPLRLSARAGR